MAAITDLLNTNWGPYSHTEVEEAIKEKFREIDRALENASSEGGIGYDELSKAVRDLLDLASTALQPSNIANWAKQPNKPGYTVGEIIYDGLTTLSQKLATMDAAIQQAAASGAVEPDSAMSDSSENAVQNKIVKAYIDAVSLRLDTLIGSNNVQGVIDTFNEVKAFLNGINTSDPTLYNKLKSLSDAISALQTTLSTKANSADVYSKSETNAAIQEAVEGIEAGETVVINSDGANIVDEHDNNSVLFAPSARQMKLMYNNFIALYNSLANIAFTNGKPTLDWVGSKTKYTLSYGTLTGCTADVAAGQVNEGALRIKLTPTQASYAFTSVTVNGESVATTATGDADGSVYLDIVVNGNITVAATAISGRAVNFNGAGCSIGAAGVAFNQDLDTTITANEHYTLPSSITVKIGNTNVAHTYTRAQDNKTATLHIDAANITGDLTITCTAVEDAHVTLAISGSNFVVKQGNTQLSNGSKVYNGSAAQTLTIEPASGYKFSTLPSADKGTMTNNGPYEASSLEIGTSVSGTLTITAAVAALDTFSIGLTVTSDVGVTWTNPSASAQTILEGSPFKITLAKVSGTGVLQIGTCAMNGGTLTPNNGVIETAHVTGDITIAASVAAAPMKVHSYDFTDVQKTEGRVDGKPKYIEDDVAGHFRLYSVNNITQNSEATEDDPAWTAPKWSPNGGSYKGSWANGISNNYRAGYGNRVLDLEPGSDFTVILKEYSLHPASGNRYKTAQIQVLFHDRSSVTIGNQLVAQQFEIQCGLPDSATYIGNGGSMYPVINTTSGLASLRGDNAEVPATPAAGDVYDVVFSYVAQTGLMSAFVVKRGSSSEVLVGGTMTKTGLAITCMQVYGYGSSVPTNLKGLELYNYAMDKTALETLYGITNND